MKKTKILFVLSFAAYFLFCSPMIWAQTKTVEPNLDFLNNIIKLDVNSDGSRKFTTYLLRRGQTYYINGTIDNTGFILTLKAEDGTGAKPIVQNYPDATGNYNTLIAARGTNTIISNIYFDGMGTNMGTGNLDPLVAQSSQMVNCDASGIVVTIDGCIFTNCNTVFIRSAGGARKVQVTNSTFANSCQISVADPGNGRFFEFRNKITDSVIVNNCTVVNLTDRFFRHLDGSGINTDMVQYVEFDHNTFVNQLGVYGTFMFGDVNKGVKFTNNLLVNCQAMGFDSTSTVLNNETLVHLEPIISMPTAGYRYLFCDEPNTGISPSFQFNNNVVMLDPAIKTLWTQKAPKTIEAPVLSKHITSLLTSGSKAPTSVTYFALKNIPKWPQAMMTFIYSSLADGAVTTTNTVDFDRHTRKYWSDSLDCSYTIKNNAFFGTDGKPIGSGQWKSVVTDVKSEGTQIPSKFSLSNNYPNPFNPSTKIQFSIPVTSNVSLIVYNLVGQEVSRLVDQQLVAGSHSVSFNAEGLSSGIYFYKLTAVGLNGEKFVSSHKMTLLK